MRKATPLWYLVRLIVVIAVAGIISVAAEILLFNYQTVESLTFEKTDPSSSRSYDQDGYHYVEYSFDNSEIQDINITSDLPENFEGYSVCSVSAIDEGSSIYYKLGDMYLGPDETYRLHPTGKVQKILVSAGPATSNVIVENGTKESNARLHKDDLESDVSSSADTTQTSVLAGAGIKKNEDGSIAVMDTLPIGLPSDYDPALYSKRALLSTPGDNILEPGEFYADFAAQFNVQIPIDISKKRLLLIFGGLLLAYALRPSSSLHRGSYKDRSFVVSLFGISSAIVLAVIVTHYGLLSPDATNQRQYIELAKALAEGHLYVDAQPSSALMAMDNPYDTNARIAAGVEYLWDYSYFDGHYYVYFGILPVLLYQLPFYLLTGSELPVVVSVAISSLLLVYGLEFLLLKMCNRWFGDMTKGMFLVLLSILFFGSWVVYACAVPGHYGLPIVTGLACLVWGLSFWIDGTRDNVIRPLESCLGSFLIALTLACRPQLLIGGLLGVVLLLGCSKRMDKKAFLKCLGIAIIPFVVVGLFIGWYNAARYGSPFDFGANYNLTTNDMTHRAFSIDRLPLALFAYLFQSPNLVFRYPYLVPTDLASGYYGLTIAENMWGGIFCLVPLLLCSLLLVFRRFREMLPATPLLMALCSFGCGLVLTIFDANGAGILMRYLMDFGIFFAISSVISVSFIWRAGSSSNALVSVSGEKGSFKAAGMFLVALLALTVLMQGLWLLNNAV